MTDPMDQPEQEVWGLAVPFVVCRSNGGQFDDDAFCAGFEAGMVEQALKTAAMCNARTVGFAVRADMVKQLELIGMHRGFPTMQVQTFDESPEWVEVTFAVENEDRP